jgi:lysozyme family protein
MANFAKAVEALIQREGGFVNDPSDSGGETKFGISKRSYPALDIPNLTKQDAADIYFADFWSPAGCDGMPQVVAEAVLDFAVTSSVKRSAKTVQQAAGVLADGVIGPDTLAAIAAHPDLIAARFTILRMAFYADLARKQKKNQKFLAGWILRSAEVLGT